MFSRNSTFQFNGIPTNLDSLEAHLLRIGLESGYLFEIYLILDEIISNVYNHAKGDLAPYVSVKVARTGSKIHMHIVDTGDQFDPTIPSMPDIKSPTEDRAVGGLGLFLVQNIVNFMDYARIGNKNSLIITKEFEAQQSRHN